MHEEEDIKNKKLKYLGDVRAFLPLFKRSPKSKNLLNREGF
jgi:hypothetical protein